MIRALVVACLLLAGCDAEPPTLKYPGFVLTIEIDPDLPTRGLAVMSPGICQITLREYPACLLHEVRHCTEGDWHAGRESDWDC
jgi:hypothetical protein